ncbi:glycosyltransferase family 2 protein [Nostoc sp. LEGE 12450]|uniref:glycosyltransferase family 2 protein n=1 Tax=Nostoc sp. LEGE 12450 TaxID=1828643 RepID=UPI001880996F|nr:glycosyltransferase family 2 protein [Nostoc sp. LEGE 12450]MBE8988441.1 glycosyltransferase family 2 protein [Nostoc sp. LEGE 12450]
MPFNYSIDIPIANVVTVGQGTYIPFSGWCLDTENQIRGISVGVDNKIHSLTHVNDLRTDVFAAYKSISPAYKSLSSGFYGMIPFAKDDIGKKLKLTLNFYYSDHVHSLDMGFVYCQSNNVVETVSKLKINSNLNEPLIAICMATYNPKIDNFKKQIDSILNQTHKNWILIVNDDKSSQKSFKELCKVCEIDQRIHVYRNESNLGFYKNFERALERVGDVAEYIALSDQDDYWYTNKLSSCLASMEPDVSLVYSDMRIVKGNGEVISNSYWVNRQNYYEDISMLLLANTVTGAACLFRRSLVKILLPFPYPMGEIFHDQWLSIVARSMGRIAYIDEPLYDYIQHGSNIIGHADFQAASPLERLFKLFKLTTQFIFSPRGSIKANLKAYVERGWAIYQYEFRRLELMATNLRFRVGDKAVTDLSILDMFNDRWFSIFPLLKKHILLIQTHTTNHAEWRLLQSRVLVTLSKRLVLSLNQLSAATKRTSKILAEPGFEITDKKDRFFQTALEAKIAPLELDISESQSIRVNILIPEINFKYLFGGYIAKFNFAILLAKAGLKVRLVIVDKCDFYPQEITEGMIQYPGLQDLLSYIEISLHYNREVTLSVNPLDSFIATTWWTAHIAHQASTQLGHPEFLYFIQEFEPFTFSMGAYFAIARQSYDFPHSALFSTALLMEYFQQQNIGVFASGHKHSPLIASFENAIQTFELPALPPKKAVKKLLFYSRPETHAARNMFEVGLMALNKAIVSGIFDAEDWEFYGIGTEKLRPSVPLANGRSLQMLGKVSLDEYCELLPEHDLGLALMYTPHPSLLPLEMAAAGMVVVTNTCINKTAERLKEISSNILAAEPTADGVAETLAKAVILSNDWNLRLTGSKVNWSSSWEQTFDSELISKIKKKLNHDGLYL